MMMQQPPPNPGSKLKFDNFYANSCILVTIITSSSGNDHPVHVDLFSVVNAHNCFDDDTPEAASRFESIYFMKCEKAEPTKEEEQNFKMYFEQYPQVRSIQLSKQTDLFFSVPTFSFLLDCARKMHAL